MAAPDFSKPTADTLAFRSALICNHPRCGALTVGPSDAVGTLKLKLGEAAHIRGAREDTARYDKTMTDDGRADIANGIWLCANCHTMIDKNNGVDFSREELEGWKKKHEGIISSLLHTHRSPLPLLRGFTNEGRIAQEAVDILEQHGALFVDLIYEADNHVMDSIESLRRRLEKLPRKVKYDLVLKDLLKDLAKEPREYMNLTSKFLQNPQVLLEAMRIRIGGLVLRLRDEFGCTVRGDLNRIVPNLRS